MLPQVPVMPVELAYQPCHGRLVLVGHVVVIDGIDVNDDVELRGL